MAQPKKGDERFDMAKLIDLQEPLSVYLERLQGNTTEPITLPALGADRNIDPAGTPGTGWRRDDVSKLSVWVRDFYCGAGTYRAQVVDMRSKAVEWEFSIPQTNEVKQKSPPPLGVGNILPPSAVSSVAPPPSPNAIAPVAQQSLAGAAQPPAGWGGPQHVPVTGWSPTPQAPPPQPPPAWSPSGWSPPNQPPPQIQVMPQGMSPYNPYGQPPPGYGPPGYNPYGQPPPWAPQAAPAISPELAKQLKQVEQQLEESKRREIELKYQQENERLRVESARQIDSLREEMRRTAEKDAGKENDEVRRAREERDRLERQREREETDRRFEALQQTILAAAANKPDDDRIRRMEEENRRRDEENKREREKEREEHRREMEKRDRDLKDAEIRREMKEQADRTERLVRDAQSKGPDPVLEVMKENARMQAESTRQLALMQQQQMQMMQQNSINPMQLMTILDKKESSGDSFMRSIMPAMTGVIELYKGAAEQVVGLAGGGPAAAWQPVAEHVISSGKEIMDRWFSMKRDVGVSENKAKIAASEAQAQTAHAAAQAQAAVAHMQAQAQRQQAGQPMNGAQEATAQPQANPAPQQAAPAAAPQEGGKVIQMPQPQPAASREQVFFGRAFESVMRMRKSVKANQVVPKQVIDGLMMGVNAYLENHEKHPDPNDPEHWAIPAFSLYEEERWADLVDVVLDGCPQPFKDECVRILVEDMEDDDNGDSAEPPDPATTV